MPKITKQTTRTSIPKKGIAGRINSVEIPEGVKMVIYGRGKTGKTRFACTFPKPSLLIGTEDGRKSVRGIKGLDFVMLERTGEIEELVNLVEGKYKTVVVDTAGGVQDLQLKEELGIDEIPIEKGWGTATRDQWSAVGQQTKERLRSILTLAQRGIHCVIIAHERSFDENEQKTDLIVPTIGPALTPSVAAWINGACDYVCQTFIRERTIKKTVKIAGKSTVLTERVEGEVDYCLRVGPHSVYMTGFRVSFNTSLPSVVVNPSFDKLKEYF